MATDIFLAHHLDQCEVCCFAAAALDLHKTCAECTDDKCATMHKLAKQGCIL